MNQNFVNRIAREIEEIKTSGLYKTERVISSPQGAEITVNGIREERNTNSIYIGSATSRAYV